MKKAIGALGDLLLVPGAGILVLIAKCYKSNFNPSIEEMKTRKKPLIVCLHGDGFNEMQWIFFRYFLAHKYHILTYNLDGLLFNDPKKSIQDYAQFVTNQIQELCEKTGYDEIAFIGHSMGGLVAAQSALEIAEKGIHVRKLIAISTPWHGSSILKKVAKWTLWIPFLYCDPIRYRQMRNENGFLTKLRDAISKSGIEVHTIYSEGDLFVNDKDAQFGIPHKHLFLGHFGPMVSFSIPKEIHAILIP